MSLTSWWPIQPFPNTPTFRGFCLDSVRTMSGHSRKINLNLLLPDLSEEGSHLLHFPQTLWCEKKYSDSGLPSRMRPHWRADSLAPHLGRQLLWELGHGTPGNFFRQ